VRRILCRLKRRQSIYPLLCAYEAAHGGPGSSRVPSACVYSSDRSYGTRSVPTTLREPPPWPFSTRRGRRIRMSLPFRAVASYDGLHWASWTAPWPRSMHLTPPSLSPVPDR
jgi:hypothetical protein